MPLATPNPPLVTPGSRASFGALMGACLIPPLLAHNLTPSATLFNQLLALAAWGAVLIGCGRHLRTPLGVWLGPRPWVLLLLLLAPCWAVFSAHAPLSVSLSSASLIAAALTALLFAQGLAGEPLRQAGGALFWGLLAAGLISAGIGVIQVFAPQLADGHVIAKSGIPGRAVGNLRQPNHLASLLMWASVAVVFLTERPGGGRRWWGDLPLVLFVLVFAVVLSASRTGYVGVGVLALWGVLDRRLSNRARLALLATPLMGLLSWGLMWVWAHSGQHTFGAAARLAEGAGSPSRLAIIANAWDLIKANPWWGVGWGEFNFAWSLSVFPDRPIAFFDHTHNLPVQLAVELGLPWAGAVLALLLWALWQAFRGAWLVPMGELEDNLLRRCALMLVLMIGIHSLLEYPLWYAYFLLPAVFALGLALPAAEPSHRASKAGPVWVGIGAVMVAGSAFAVWDYSRIVDIYAPSANAAPLATRIAVGQRSPLFGHHADYASATSLPPGPEALAAAKRTAFSLIDARLLMQWSKSLAATGDVESARFLADRLREFKNSSADEWFAECEVAGDGEPPYQCTPSKTVVDWRRLR